MAPDEFDPSTKPEFIRFSKEELRLVSVLFRHAGPNATSYEAFQATLKGRMGMHGLQVTEGVDEKFFTDPPTPEELQGQLVGQRLYVDLTDVAAFNTLMTVYIMKATSEGVGIHQAMSDWMGIMKKVREVYTDLDDDVELDDWSVGP